MPGRSPKSPLAAASAGLLVIGGATAAHLSAGGSVDVFALIGLAALSVPVSIAVASRVRLTFARAITATLLMQPVMHAMLGHRTPMASDAPAHMDHAMPMPETGTQIASSMMITHGAVALLGAIVIRWGVRWLRSMPSIARALVVRARGLVAPVVQTGDRTPSAPETVPVPLAILFAWETRGPPR